MSKKYKVLYIHHDGNISGSAISLLNILKFLDRQIFTPFVILGSYGPLKELYERMGIEVHIIPLKLFSTSPGFKWNKLSFYKNWFALLPNKKLRDLINLVNPDIIHINDKSILVAGIESRMFGVPIIWHVRSSYFPSKSKFQAKASCWIIKKLATELIVISEDEMDGFEDLANATIIHNSVDFSESKQAIENREKTRKELGLSQNDLAIGTITTTINEVRGTWDFINASGIIKRKFNETSIKFYVTAKIPPKKENHKKKLFFKEINLHPYDQAFKLVNDNNLSSIFTFTGYRSDPLNIMAAMDIVVICNRHGVLGRMPFEAMSVGTPIVATTGHSGKSNVVINYESGILVKPADPESIAEGVSRLISDRNLREKISKNGKISVINNFNPKLNIQKIQSIYEKVLKRSE